MVFDREEWETGLKQKRKELVRARKHELEVLAQSPIAMESLTGDATWDPFLQILQSKIEKATRALDLLKEQMVEAGLVDHEGLLQQKIQAKIFQTEIETLKDVIALPMQIRESGEQAKEALDELGPA
ncbi:MAG: hypothetical protein V3R58_08510 [candidate division NC10 bacterium]